MRLRLEPILVLALLPQVPHGGTAPLQAQPEGLVLVLSPEKSTDIAKDELAVTFRIQNAGSRPVKVFPYFESEGVVGQQENRPLNFIRFLITTETGETVAHRGLPGHYAMLDVGVPQPSSLVALPEGMFVGRTVSLSSGLFSHDLPRRTRVRIRAEFVSDVGSWAEAHRAIGLEAQELANIFRGTLVSNEIVMTTP